MKLGRGSDKRAAARRTVNLQPFFYEPVTLTRVRSAYPGYDGKKNGSHLAPVSGVAAPRDRQGICAVADVGGNCAKMRSTLACIALVWAIGESGTVPIAMPRHSGRCVCASNMSSTIVP